MTHEKEQPNPLLSPPPAEEMGLCAGPKPGPSGQPRASEDAWVGDVWLDDTPYDPSKPDPFEETRLPEEGGPPYPPGLADPLSPDLIDAARSPLRWILSTFWSLPRWMMWVGDIWQWRKFELLDWLRPLELLLRRLVMIEALSLLASHALPSRKRRSAVPKTWKAAGATESTDQKRKPAPICDPDHPQTWKVSFTVIPRTTQPAEDPVGEIPRSGSSWPNASISAGRKERFATAACFIRRCRSPSASKQLSAW